MTTEQRIASCFQRIQELESRRAKMIEDKNDAVQELLNPKSHPLMIACAASFIEHADEVLIQIYNQQEALRRLAEHLSGLLAAFPRPQPTSG